METLSLEEIAKLLEERVREPSVLPGSSGPVAAGEKFAGFGRSLLALARSVAVGRRRLVSMIGVDGYILGRRRRLYNEDLHHGATALLFLHDWVHNGHELVRSLIASKPSLGKAMQYVRKCLIEVNRLAREKGFASVMGDINAASTPLAFRIALAIASHFSPYSWFSPDVSAQFGMRINVTATLGAGKTSFVFWSGVAALRLAGMSMEEAVKCTYSLFMKDLRQLLDALEECARLAEKGMLVPFLVLDDAVVSGLCKYDMSPAFGGKLSHVIAQLNKMITVAREGVGAIIIIGHVNMLPKPLREENVDMVIEGVAMPRLRGGVSTIWVAKVPGTRSGIAGMRYIPVDITATIVPTILIPREIYRELEKIKLEKRVEAIRELKEMYMKVMESKEEEEGEEESEEL